MKKRTLLAVLLTSLISSTHGEIYKWVDDKGQVHYSDKPSSAHRSQTLKMDINSYSSDYQGYPRVIMYSTDWCGYCRKARQHFRAQGIRFTDHDIEKNDRAKREYDKLGGKGVPVILIGQEGRMNGFSTGRFDQLYRQASASKPR